jgi:hypothetical protein
MLMLPRYVSRSISAFDLLWIGYSFFGSYGSMVRTLFLIRTDLSLWYNIVSILATLFVSMFSFITFFIVYFVMLTASALFMPFMIV